MMVNKVIAAALTKFFGLEWLITFINIYMHLYALVAVDFCFMNTSTKGRCNILAIKYESM